MGYIKVSLVVSEDQEQCEPGFSERRYAFTVTRKILERGRVLGKVSFTSCSANNHALYSPDDTRIRVFPDGKVTVKRLLTLHDGSLSFVLNAWDAKGTRHSVPIFVWNEREQQDLSPGENKDVDKTRPHLRRQKREIIIPPINIPENQRGQFPKRIGKITSTSETTTKVIYRINGPGSDKAPVEVFTIDEKTGILMVTGPLDREAFNEFNLLVSVTSESGPVENPVEFTIKIEDQNDNRPVFTQKQFEGVVKEGALPGTSVMTVSATDLDDAEESDNGLVQYSIISQLPHEPNDKMFRIDSKTGLISVDKSGLSYEKSKKYSLLIMAADMDGNGLTATSTAVITVLQEEMSGGSDSLLSTHVLNTAQGIPAKGLTITLSKLDASQARWIQVSRSVTNEDGRCPGLLRGEPLTAGTFQLRFDTKDYWKQMQQDSFYPYVEVVFTITDPKQKYHVPLLLSPFSYTTYRGS
ncbi:blastomere cadherin-like isoform X2 [Rhinoderma darwinii]|uniref:blastomere cadherin-like isoform X2 n=1 Tax=Rhinoderma darwinii TaxID=43563 RepID=UPI003F66175D